MQTKEEVFKDKMEKLKYYTEVIKEHREVTYKISRYNSFEKLLDEHPGSCAKNKKEKIAMIKCDYGIYILTGSEDDVFFNGEFSLYFDDQIIDLKEGIEDVYNNFIETLNNITPLEFWQELTYSQKALLKAISQGDTDIAHKALIQYKKYVKNSYKTDNEKFIEYYHYNNHIKGELKW